MKSDLPASYNGSRNKPAGAVRLTETRASAAHPGGREARLSVLIELQQPTGRKPSEKSNGDHRLEELRLIRRTVGAPLFPLDRAGRF